MHKKHYVALLGALALGAFQVSAQDAATTAAPAPAPAPVTAPAAAPAAPAAPSWSWTLTPSYASVYMFRGQRLGGQSFQPSISGTYGNWTLGVWGSTPVNDAAKVHGQSDPEVDPNGTYTIAINDHFNIQPGFTWYTYFNAPTNLGFFKDTFEPSVAVNYTIDGVTVTPKYYYDVVLYTATYEINLAYSLPLKELGTSLNFAFQYGEYYGTNVVNGSTPRTKAWGTYFTLGVSTPYQITKNSVLTVGFAFADGQDAYFKQAGQPRSSNTAAVRRCPITVSYAWTF